MSKLDELMLTGRWVEAIRHVRSTTRQRGKILLLSRAILFVSLQAYNLGILDGAPLLFFRHVDHDITAR